MRTLLIMKGAVVDQRVPLPGAGGRLVLGRGRSNGVVLDDHGRLVSRRHAEIRTTASGYTVIDLDSENGIWRCGTRVARVPLDTDEPIIIGPYRLLLAAVDVGPVTPPGPLSTGSSAAVLIGAGLLIGLIGGALVMWLLVSAWSRPAAAQAFEAGTLAAVAKVAPATGAPEARWHAPDMRREDPA